MLRRALRNAGLLLTGKAAAGLMQLATFAIAARSLGLTDFGNLSVMLAGIQLLIVLATFQSNQAIVRYGVLHLNSADRAAFQRMIKLGVLLDLVAAAAAVAAALLLAPIIAEQAGWTARQTDAWRLLALLPATIALATPKGLLRLFGRFDLLARHVTVTPLARLAGAMLLAMTGAGLMGWVVMWLLAGAAGLLVAFWLAIREARRRHLLGGMAFDFRGLRDGNPGMIRFAMLSNLHSSLVFLPGHLATFSVGMVLGPQSAGLMKVAQELGSGLAKPIDLINQAVYPDIARLSTAELYHLFAADPPRLAVMPVPAWTVPLLRSEPYKAAFTVAGFPGGANAGQAYGFVALSSDDPKRLSTVVDLMTFVAAPDQQVRLARQTGLMPARKSAPNPFDGDPQMTRAFQLAGSFRPLPLGPAWEAAQPAIAHELLLALYGSRAPGEALQEASKLLDQATTPAK